MSTLLHATLVARFIDGWTRGALIRAPSGGGKSTLALRCLDAGFRLAADDRVMVFASARRLFGKPPPSLAGLLEVRGVGVIPVAALQSPCPIDLVIDLVDEAERLPEARATELLGVSVPVLELPLDNPDLPLRISVALAAPWRRL